MCWINELHLDYLSPGPDVVGAFECQRYDVGLLHMQMLTRKMGIETIYRRLNASKPALSHEVCPYLLKKFAITRPNQIWTMDILVMLCAIMLLRRELFFERS